MRVLPRAHRLADGATVHVRDVRPSDEHVMRAGFGELSAVDGRDHIAIIAIAAGESLPAGVESFVAYALPNNVGVRRLLARQGPLRVSVAGGEETIVVQLCGSRAA
jgi:hypothetical protein